MNKSKYNSHSLTNSAAIKCLNYLRNELELSIGLDGTNNHSKYKIYDENNFIAIRNYSANNIHCFIKLSHKLFLRLKKWKIISFSLLLIFSWAQSVVIELKGWFL